MKKIGPQINGFSKFTIVGQQVNGVICTQCDSIDGNFGSRSEVDLERYPSNAHICLSNERKRHQAESVILESASFFSADDQSMQNEEASFVLPKQICKNQIVIEDNNEKMKISVDCLEEFPTLAEINRHKKKCPLRNKTAALNENHKHETARIFWNAMKNSGLASSLLKVINDDLLDGSAAEFGVSKLRSNVCVNKVDIFALDNSTSLHFAKKQEHHLSRRKSEEINLSSDDVRLIAGPGQSIRTIKKMVTELNKKNIPTDKAVVEKIRSERQDVLRYCENIICRDVQRRSKHRTGHSHLGLVLYFLPQN